MASVPFWVFSSILIFLHFDFGNALISRKPKAKGVLLDYFESCPDKPLPSPKIYGAYQYKIFPSEEDDELLLFSGEMSLTKELLDPESIKVEITCEYKKRGFWTKTPYTIFCYSDCCPYFFSDNKLWDNVKANLTKEQKSCPVKVGEIFKLNNTKLEGYLYDIDERVPGGVYRITVRFTVYFTDYVEDACIILFANYQKL